MTPNPPSLSRRSYFSRHASWSWEELWEAANYYDRVSELLEEARESVMIVGWQIDSRLPMRRPARPPGRPEPSAETLKHKLLRLCEEKPELRFYLLIWDHACFYVPERERWQGRVWDDLHPRIHFVFDNRHPLGASHHEKLCLVDGRIALCGGIDLCDDRWDSPRHLHHDPRRSLSGRAEEHGPYHDLAVQVSGPICADLHHHVAERWRKLSGIPFPRWRPLNPDSPGTTPGESGGHSVYLSRTVARVGEGRGRNTRIIREVEFLYRDLIRMARHRLILEGQYFWSREILDLLITRMRETRGSGFELVLILADLRDIRSLTRLMNPYEVSLLQRLRLAAQATGTRLTLGIPYSHPPPGASTRARAIYVHSKILIADDRFLSVGSTNFAARALRVDTEINLTLEGETLEQQAHIRRFARELQEHWSLADPLGEISLHQLPPVIRLCEDRRRSWLAAPPGGQVGWVPWHRLFDPDQVAAAAVKRPISRLARRHPRLTLLALSLASALGGLALSAFFSLGDSGPIRGDGVPGVARWEFFELAVLSQAWILPLPFTALATLGGLVLAGLTDRATGAELGARLAVISLWVASVFGYAAARAFPSWTLRIQTRSRRLRRLAALAARLPRGPWQPGHLPGAPRDPRARSRLESRSFSELITVLFNPRASIRSKIALQGLACVPVQWFFLGSLLLLPALYSVGLRAWVVLAPRPMIEWATELAAPIFAGAR